MKYCLSLVLALSPALAQQPAVYRPGFDVLDYAISIDLPDSGNVIRGDAMITVRRTMRGDTLTLDLVALRVERVTVDRQATGFVRTESTLLVPLPRTVGDTATFVVDVTYGGAVTDGLVARRDSAGRWTYFGDNWPNRARLWIPSIDHPSDKATVSWSVRAPSTQTVVANGALVESRVLSTGAHGRTLTRWRESVPIAPYLMVIAAAPLVETDLGQTACGLAELERCVPQAVFTAPEQHNVVPGEFVHAREIVAFFASLVGPFPYEKLYHFQSMTRFGGMENATAIFYADALFRRDRIREGIIAHETAHQWFGDAVTEQDWPHLWLSEGFATYFDALWTQHAHGDSAFVAQMTRTRDEILDDTASVVNRPVIDTIETNLLALLNTNSYQKGGFVLHMLRSQLGDSAFFGGLRAYYAAHKNGNATSDDLRVALERASGQPLGAFFDQWLRRPGYPIIEVGLLLSAGYPRPRIEVEQSSDYGYFDFPLDVVLADASGHTTIQTVHVLPRPSTRVDVACPNADHIADVDPKVKALARISYGNE
jgi:aminopeptidase N